MVRVRGNGEVATVEKRAPKAHTMSVNSSMYFLDDIPLYQEEKPYRLKFQPSSDIPATNIQVKKHEVNFTDTRSRVKDYSLKKNGFQLIPMESTMLGSDFEDDAKIKKVYLTEVGNSLKKLTSASRVQIFEHLVRKSYVNFPHGAGEDLPYKQSTTVAHIDLTGEWGSIIARRLNHKIGLGNVPYSNYQYINVWKPLRGPVRDWPLALCDPKTVTPTLLQDGDVMFDDFAIENRLLQYGPK
ncbi:hypothetical protein DL98DRAFT_588208 [Cadophora sp. DSE1049]|nr:hypothetical protein DL98DRAFT_588208 [Cadophora sp. DSE1049]